MNTEKRSSWLFPRLPQYEDVHRFAVGATNELWHLDGPGRFEQNHRVQGVSYHGLPVMLDWVIL